MADITIEKPLSRPRDRAEEKRLARGRKIDRLSELSEFRVTGKLGDEVIKIAQAMLLCTLPYSATKERQITRQARLGDGSTLFVTFTAGFRGVELPYGSDRKLLAWILDKAINSESPYISWQTALDYQREMGMAKSGKNNKDLQQRFRRVAGLVINIQRKGSDAVSDTLFPIIERSYLPASIRGKEIEGTVPLQQSLPEMADRYGFVLNTTLFHDIRKHHVAIPRLLWTQSKGNSQVQDFLLWLYCRCYAAHNESLIPWKALREQFPADSNPRRAKENMREAIKILQVLWPGVRVEAREEGIWVDRPNQPLLSNDPDKKRDRKS